MTMKKTITVLLSLALFAAMFAGGCLLTEDGEKSDSKSYSVSGRVVTYDNYSIENVSLRLEGTSSDDSQITRSAISDYRGNYIFEKVPNGEYAITPYMANFGFYPGSGSVTVSGRNTSGGTFTGYSTGGGSSGSGYSISGSVKGTENVNVKGLIIALSGGEYPQYTSTGDDGSFSFEGLQPGTYLISPSGANIRFVPATMRTFVRSFNITLSPFSAEPSNEVLPGETRYDHDFFPLINAAAWTYQVSETANGVETTDTETVIAQGTVSVYGKEYYVLRDMYDDPLSLVRVDADSVYMFHDITALESLHLDSGSSLYRPAEISELGPDEDPFIHAWPVYPLNANEGDTYLLFNHQRSEVGAAYFWDWAGKYHGTEDVTVGAGTFKNSRKYETVFDAIGSTGSSTIRQVHRKTSWLGYRAGIVKIHEEWYEDGVLVRERTKELVGYSIP